MIDLKNNQAIAIAKYVRMSPTKVRRVLKQIQGLSYKNAIMILKFMPYRSCSTIWQVLHSAASNAENNLGLSKQNLFIKTAFVNQGPTLKRFRPRAKGRGYQILKPTCHISIIVENTK
jgi:large subunit ribosomal protein L22